MAFANLHAFAFLMLLHGIVIDGEDRRLPTRREYHDFGNAVGSVECRIPGTDEAVVSTGYLVAADVVHSSAHGYYTSAGVALDAVGGCTFNLHDAGTGRSAAYAFTQVVECPGYSPRFDPGSCDWTLAKLVRPVPEAIRPLQLLVTSAESLEGRPALAIGHHPGVQLHGAQVRPTSMLVAAGTIRAKSGARYGQYPQLILYSMDTSPVSSGQPILVEQNGSHWVVGSHRGGYTTDGAGSSWDPRDHFNYGELLGPQVIEAIRSLAAPVSVPARRAPSTSR
jgi:hypothetical protein